MNRIINRRPGILVLPRSKLVLKPKETAEVKDLTDELQRAVSRGWIELVKEDTPEAKAQRVTRACQALEAGPRIIPWHWKAGFSTAAVAIIVLGLILVLSAPQEVQADLAPILARAVQGKSDPNKKEKLNPFSHLTPRETEILGLLAEGQSNKVIARNLGISDGTVKLHVKAILRKLNVHSRVEVAVMAVENGLQRASILPSS